MLPQMPFLRLLDYWTKSQTFSVTQVAGSLWICYWLYNFVQTTNLPFTSEGTKQVCQNCNFCAEVKPRFYITKRETSVKATRPWERLAVVFNGPVKGSRSYLLVVIDEYSRYPFVYPCKNLSSSTVIECISSLFCTFGFPEFIHRDCGGSFVSKELRAFLSELGIATSYSSPYHPQGNGQCERANQTIWRTIKLLLGSSNLQQQELEKVLSKALHAFWSLLCRTNNQTPHERLLPFSRRAMAGTELPYWLLEEESKVLLRRFVRDKSEPLCDVVELLITNPI